MRILNQRVYIVTSPPLAAAVQRASKTLSFTPIIPEVTRPVFGLDDATTEIVRRNLDPGPDDEQGYLAEIQSLVYTSLGPGRYLNELTLDAVGELRDEVAAYAALDPRRGATGAGAGAVEEDLLLWVRHLVTVATARFLYGPENPIALEPGLEEAFWDFDHGLVALLMGPCPALTARRAYRGRERLAAALGDYLEAGRHKASSSSSWAGSRIIRRRVEIALRHGWTLRMAARSELSFLFAGIINTTVTTFWILSRLYADAELLGTVRGEIAAVVLREEVGEAEDVQEQEQDEQEEQERKKGREEEEEEEKEEEKKKKKKKRLRIRIPALRERCPTLVAVYSECLRLGSDNFSNRMVKGDTVLADRYLLRKGAIVQVAGGVIHADEGIWGGDVELFNPARFLPGGHGGSGEKDQQQQQQRKQQQRHPAAFRAFGGGKTLCPGRHFAQSEILALVALVLLQLDMEQGAAGLPGKRDTVMPVHILEPAEPVKAAISRRADGDGGVDVRDVDFAID